MDFGQVTEYLDSLEKRYGVQAVDCKVMKGHKVIYRHMAGFSDFKKSVPVTEQVMYDVYSCTKVVTMVAVMQLTEQGKLGLDDPLDQYLPEFAHMRVAAGFEQGKWIGQWPDENAKTHPAKNKIRIHQLMSMTAGLSYDLSSSAIRRLLAEKGDMATTREIAAAVSRMPLLFEPGTHFSYSIAHDVLAAVVEEASGMEFGAYMKKNVFEPLGIKDMYYQIPPSEKHRMAAFYTLDPETGEAVPGHGNMSRLSGRHESGGGGIACTVDEYCKILEALANGGVGGSGCRILTKESIETMSTNRLNELQLQEFHRYGKQEYGYGLGVRTLMDTGMSGSPLGEFGWDGAYGAYALADPVNHVSIFYAQVMAVTPVVHGVIHPTLRDLVYGALKEGVGQEQDFQFTWENPRKYDSAAGLSPLRDPFILRDGEVWYLTGTLPPYDVSDEASRTKGVPLYRSTDLKHWSFEDYIVKTPAEAEGKWYSERFWAPELFCRNGKYYVAVNCSGLGASAQSTHGHLFAWADRIEGPYTIMNPEGPLRLGNDAHLFADEDGQVYLFASGIWSAGLDLENLRFLTEGKYPAAPVPGSEAWNGRRERVDFEGPFVLKYRRKYYLFYSTWARGYEVGVAAADALDGEWRLIPDPMYGSINRGSCREYGGIYEEDCYPAQDKYRESGHNSVFDGPDGEPWIAAHAYDYESGDVKLVMDKLDFTEEGGVAVVDMAGRGAVRGPSWGKQTLKCDLKSGGRSPKHALDVWVYGRVKEGYTLPAKIDILLANGFRASAPVRWDRQPDSGRNDGGVQLISGTAVYEGRVYPVTAHVGV